MSNIISKLSLSVVLFACTSSVMAGYSYKEECGSLTSVPKACDVIDGKVAVFGQFKPPVSFYDNTLGVSYTEFSNGSSGSSSEISVPKTDTSAPADNSVGTGLQEGGAMF